MNSTLTSPGDVAGEWPAQRVALFVDTQNLYYAARDNYAKHVDYEVLLRTAVRGRMLMQANAYVVEREGEATAYGFFSKLSTLGYRVKRRSVRYHRSNDNGQPIPEGDWDAGIIADMVRSWEQYDVIILASGDGDFVPILQVAQERGKRIEVLAFRETTSQTLIDQVDRFINLSDLNNIFVQ